MVRAEGELRGGEVEVRSVFTTDIVEKLFASGEALAGGVVSDVRRVPMTQVRDALGEVHYQVLLGEWDWGDWADGWHIVIKHTLSAEERSEPVPAPFTHADAALLEAAPATHGVDIAFLQALDGLGGDAFEVPRVLYADAKNRYTVMPDFGDDDGYGLLQDRLVSGDTEGYSFDPRHGYLLGYGLRELNESVKTVGRRIPLEEDPKKQFAERLEEMRTLFGYSPNPRAKARYRAVAGNDC